MRKRRSKKKKDVNTRKFIPIAAISLFIIICILCNVLTYTYFNVSTQSDRSFTNSLNASLEQARKWIVSHRTAIIENADIALLKMLDECSQMNRDSSIAEIVKTFMSIPAKPDCWRALIDPNRPVNQTELNETIEKESIDNKWTLYAIGRGNVNVTAEQIGLFDGSRWKGRQLNHQLWGLTHLRERTKSDNKINTLIDHLTNRIKKKLKSDTAVVDIFIQKIAFTLRAGFPEKIRRRWVERVISNQGSDGAWDDKWLCFTSGRRPVFRSLPTNPRATIQAYWLLCQVKYKYPDYFGVVKEKAADKAQTNIKSL